jgi:hypothetical protein
MGTLAKMDVLKVRNICGFLFTEISPLKYFNSRDAAIDNGIGVIKTKAGSYPGKFPVIKAVS